MPKTLLLLLLLLNFSGYAQLKFIVQDFEGCSKSADDLSKISAFRYGSAQLKFSQSKCTGKGYSGRTAIEQYQEGGETYGGWGIGVTRLIQLETDKDYFNLFVYSKEQQKASVIVFLQDDDNHDKLYNEANDDQWKIELQIDPGENWQLKSIPLSRFKDANPGGDNTFNMDYKKGMLIAVLFRNSSTTTANVLFDFISFSKGPLSPDPFSVSPKQMQSQCIVGAWSDEGQQNPMFDIAYGFANCTKDNFQNIGLIHSFHPFSDDGGTLANKFPIVKNLEEVTRAGMIPMITLENQFLGVKEKRQPSLKAVAEGRYDDYFKECAKRFRQVNGKILVRVMHEFNGDWYPWCIANNGNDPEIYKQAFRRIVKNFRDAKADNVLFVWCVNSVSLPQESWNYVVDAYPGDDVVDIVASDVYNGAEKGNKIWRSFRKEAAEMYFLLTENFPTKPIMICEMSSREREKGDGPGAPGKADWIYEASEALKTDFSRFFVASWFNSRKYKINTSEESRKAFVSYFWSDPYFRYDPKLLDSVIKR